MQIRQIELRLLDCFVEVVDAGSIKAASNELNISQPALSRLIHRLESDLGVVLLDRGPRGVTPTRYGDILYRNARLLADQERTLRWELEALRGLEQGIVAVGVSPYLGDYMMPPLIARLLCRRPGIGVRVQSGTYPDLLRALLSGETDVLFSALPAEAERDDIRFTVIRSSEQAVVSRAGHALCAATGIALKHLGKYPWILPAFPAHHERELVDAFLSAGLKPPRFPIQTNNVFLAREMIAAGEYLSIMPRAMLQAPAIRGRIVELNSDFSPAPTNIGYATRARSTLPPAARELIALAAEALR